MPRIAAGLQDLEGWKFRHFPLGIQRIALLCGPGLPKGPPHLLREGDTLLDCWETQSPFFLFCSRGTNFGSSLQHRGPRSQSQYIFQKVGTKGKKCQLNVFRVGRGDTRPDFARKSNIPLLLWSILAPSARVSSSPKIPFAFSRPWDCRSIAVDKYARPGYPRRTRDWWWSCGQRESIVGELRDRNGEGKMELRNSLAERLRDRDHVDVVGELRVASDAKKHPSLLPLQLFLVLSSIKAFPPLSNDEAAIDVRRPQSNFKFPSDSFPPLLLHTPFKLPLWRIPSVAVCPVINMSE